MPFFPGSIFGKGFIGSQAACDSDFASVILLVPFDGANGNLGPYPDLSNQAQNVTAGSAAALSTAQKKFGSASLGCLGVGFASVPGGPGSVNCIFNADFTMEGWFFLPSFLTAQIEPIFDWGDTSNGFAIRLYYDLQGGGPPAAAMTLQASFIGWQDITSLTTPPTANAWNHFAVVKSGDLGTLYINGEGTSCPPGLWPDVPCAGIDASYIGFTPIPVATFFTGFIDEFRVSTIARYTADFNPPSQPFGEAC